MAKSDKSNELRELSNDSSVDVTITNNITITKSSATEVEVKKSNSMFRLKMWFFRLISYLSKIANVFSHFKITKILEKWRS